MNILLVAPMPPQPQAPGAIPLVLYAQLTGLMAHHAVTLVTVAGPDRSEWAALDRLQIMGVDVRGCPSFRTAWSSALAATLAVGQHLAKGQGPVAHDLVLGASGATHFESSLRRAIV